MNIKNKFGGVIRPLNITLKHDNLKNKQKQDAVRIKNDDLDVDIEDVFSSSDSGLGSSVVSLDFKSNKIQAPEGNIDDTIDLSLLNSSIKSSDFKASKITVPQEIMNEVLEYSSDSSSIENIDLKPTADDIEKLEIEVNKSAKMVNGSTKTIKKKPNDLCELEIKSVAWSEAKNITTARKNSENEDVSLITGDEADSFDIKSSRVPDDTLIVLETPREESPLEKDTPIPSTSGRTTFDLDFSNIQNENDEVVNMTSRQSGRDGSLENKTETESSKKQKKTGYVPIHERVPEKHVDIYKKKQELRPKLSKIPIDGELFEVNTEKAPHPKPRKPVHLDFDRLNGKKKVERTNVNAEKNTTGKPSTARAPSRINKGTNGRINTEKQPMTSRKPVKETKRQLRQVPATARNAKSRSIEEDLDPISTSQRLRDEINKEFNRKSSSQYDEVNMSDSISILERDERDLIMNSKALSLYDNSLLSIFKTATSEISVEEDDPFSAVKKMLETGFAAISQQNRAELELLKERNILLDKIRDELMNEVDYTAHLKRDEDLI